MRTIIAVAMIALCSVMLTGCPEMTNTTEAPPIVKVGDLVYVYTNSGDSRVQGNVTSVTANWIVLDGEDVFNINNVTRISFK